MSIYVQKGEIITIASGHYPQKGACSQYGDETTLARALCERIVQMLREKGYNAKDCTPPNGSYSVNSQLQKEVALANSYNAKLHLCIHFNAGGGEGTEQWIYANGGNAEQFARQLQSEMVKATGYKNRGVKVSGNSLYVPRKTNNSCVLMEIAFVDSKSDMGKYNKEVVARAIFKAVTGVDFDSVTVNAEKPVVEENYNAIADVDMSLVTIDRSSVLGNIKKGDKIKIKDFSNELKMMLVEVNGITGFIPCDSNISLINKDKWINGGSVEKVYGDNNKAGHIDTLPPHKTATVLKKENGMYFIIYENDQEIKAGFVEFGGC